METPAVSLLIAVYNTETYLERCLDSLLNQSLANIEIVAVNDGSTDQSPAILETYQKRDERIRVIHQQNRGLGAVRNKGIARRAANLSLLLMRTTGLNLIIACACMKKRRLIRLIS